MAAFEVWTDVYGAIHARLAGRAGGHAWLIAAPPKQGQASAHSLQALLSGEGQRLKGSLELLIHEGGLPLETALRAGNVYGVLLVGPALAAGPALDVPAQTFHAPSGLVYYDSGSLPAWQAALKLPGIRKRGPDAAASLCAALSVPVVVCPPERLGEALLTWAGSVPHGLAL